MTITSHFWNESKESLDSAVLQCSRIIGSHTAEMIFSGLEESFNQKNISGKVLTAVTDNATNVVAAVNKLGLRHLSCYAHTLNLVVMDSFEASPLLKDLRRKVSALVTLLQGT